MAVLPPDPVFCLRSQEMGPVNSICFHQNERILAGTAKGTVHLWDLQTNRSPLHFIASGEPILSLHHFDEFLVTQEKGGCVKKWLLTNTGYVLGAKEDANHMGFCRADSITDADILVFPTKKNEISVLCASKFDILQTLTPKSSEPCGILSCLRITHINENCYIIAGYESGLVITWDLRNSKSVSEEKFDEMPLTIDYEPISNRGFCGGPGDRIAVFSFQRNTLDIEKKMDITIKNPGLNCLRIRADRKVFASGGWDGRIRIFSWKSLRPLAVLTEHKSGGVMDIAYSSGKVSMWNAPIMAAGGVDGQVTLWDLYN